jgi:hypothetical protein
MTFVQVIEFKARDIDQLRQAGDEWEQTTEGKGRPPADDRTGRP